MCEPIHELSMSYHIEPMAKTRSAVSSLRHVRVTWYLTTETDLGKTARRLGALRTTLLYCEHDI